MKKRGRPPHPDILTPREWEVLDLVRDGLSNEEIAGRLGISVDGVKYHVSEILSKLGLENRHDAARWQPTEERPWWATAFAPLFFWRRMSFGWLSPALAGGLAVIVAAGIGLLVWGLLATQGADETFDAGEERDWESVEEFIAAKGDPCSLPRVELLATVLAPYPDLATLVNDVDLVVLGRMVSSTARPLAPSDSTGEVLSQFEVEETLVGSAPGGDVTIVSSDRLMLSRGQVERIFPAGGLDPCASSELVLFLKHTWEPGEYGVAAQGWVGAEEGAVSPAPYSTIFDAYPRLDDLAAAVRSLAQEQASQGIPGGWLVCESERKSQRGLDPIVCAGDTFNPYGLFRLETAEEATLTLIRRRTSGRAVGRVDIDRGSPEFFELLQGLNAEVTLEPSDPQPPDVVRLQISDAEPFAGRTDYHFYYSPADSVVWVTASNAQFIAQEGFRRTIERLLASAEGGQ